MLWSIANRFGFDGSEWTVRRVKFWYRGHVAMFGEDQQAIAKATEAALNGRS